MTRPQATLISANIFEPNYTSIFVWIEQKLNLSLKCNFHELLAFYKKMLIFFTKCNKILFFQYVIPNLRFWHRKFKFYFSLPSRNVHESGQHFSQLLTKVASLFFGQASKQLLTFLFIHCMVLNPKS